jgi:hypothetical protein
MVKKCAASIKKQLSPEFFGSGNSQARLFHRTCDLPVIPEEL